MKLKNPISPESEVRSDSRISQSVSAKRPPLGAFAAFALAVSIPGCTFDSKGLPALDVSAAETHSDVKSDMGMDGKSASDLRISDIQRDKSPKADRTADYRKPDYTAFDVKKPDLPKPDMPKGDSYAPCATASTGKFSGLLNVGNSVTVGGYIFTYTGPGAMNDALFDISCAGIPIAKGKSFTVNVQSAINLPQDSKQILVTPYSATINYTVVKIWVEIL